LKRKKEANEIERKKILHNERYVKIALYPRYDGCFLGGITDADFQDLLDGFEADYAAEIAQKEAEEKRIREENEALKAENEKKRERISRQYNFKRKAF